MTTIDFPDLERELAAAHAFLPGDGARRRMDARMEAALSGPARRTLRLSRPRPLVLVLGLVAVLVTGAAGGSTLLDRLFRDAAPGVQVAWDRATGLGLSETVHGVTVGVDRAYMDGSQIVIGLTSEGYTYAGAALRVDGRAAAGGGVVSNWPTAKGSAHMLVFRTPPGVGAHAKLELVVPRLWRPDPDRVDAGSVAASPATSPESGAAESGPYPDKIPVDGPWRFTFDLPNHGGTGWHGEVSDTAAGVTITLHRLAVSPTSVQAWVSWSGDPLRASEDDVWSPWSALTHDGQRFAGGGGTTGNRSEINVQRGSDDPAGRWTLRIDRLTSDPGYPPRRVTIEGPWVFKIDVPPDGDPAS